VLTEIGGHAVGITEATGIASILVKMASGSVSVTTSVESFGAASPVTDLSFPP
jgi:hypothetical protein